VIKRSQIGKLLLLLVLFVLPVFALVRKTARERTSTTSRALTLAQAETEVCPYLPSRMQDASEEEWEIFFQNYQCQCNPDEVDEAECGWVLTTGTQLDQSEQITLTATPLPTDIGGFPEPTISKITPTLTPTKIPTPPPAPTDTPTGTPIPTPTPTLFTGTPFCNSLKANGQTKDDGPVTVTQGEKIIVEISVSNFGIACVAPVDTIGQRCAEAPLEQRHFLEGHGDFEIQLGTTNSDLALPPGTYVIDLNSYESDDCYQLCSAGSMIYQNSCAPGHCLEGSCFSATDQKCQSGCVQWFTIQPGGQVQGESDIVLASEEGEIWLQTVNAPSIGGFSNSVQTGDAVVNYPLALPPAAGGFGPSLSLNYSSGAVEDMRVGLKKEKYWYERFHHQGSYTGLGWSLSGIPQIMKNSKGEYFLTLNGRSFELIPDRELVGDEYKNYYGKAAWKTAFYRTRPESHLLIMREGVDAKPGGDWWDWRTWHVRSKNGTHYVFEKKGYLVVREVMGDGKHKYRRNGNKWLMTQASDLAGNQITYDYITETKALDFRCDWCEDKNQDPVYPRAIYPKTIQYGKDLQNRIDFVYSAREDWAINDQGDDKKANSFGKQKLDRIEIYLGDHRLRNYQLVHDYFDAPDDDDWGDPPEGEPRRGHLQLKQITLQNGSGTAFPVNQSFEYYSRTDPSHYLLQKAHNGYGAAVEYQYREIQLPIARRDLKNTYSHNAVFPRNQLVKKIITSQFNQPQTITYEYLGYDEANNNGEIDPSYCEQHGSDCRSRNERFCYNATATGYGGKGYIGFRFSGYRFVKETVSTPEKTYLTTHYKFNQGYHRGEDIRWAQGDATQCWNVFEPSSYKGTLAKTVITDPEGQPLSISESDYAADNDFVRLTETRACTDLDVSDSHQSFFGQLLGSQTESDELRRGSKTGFEYEDEYGNRTDVKNYNVKKCGLTGSSMADWQVILDADSNPFQIGHTDYRLVNDGTTYLVNQPRSTGIKDYRDQYLQRGWLEYNDVGLLHVSRQFDMQKWYQQGKQGLTNFTQKTFDYDQYGNVTNTVVWDGYGQTAPSDQDKGEPDYNQAIWPDRAQTTATTYDQTFAVFPKTITNNAGHVTTTNYDFEGVGYNPQVLGLAVTVTDPNQATVQSISDSFGRSKKTILPGDSVENPTTEYSYYLNATAVPFAGKLSQKQDENQRLTSWTFYDDLGRRLQTQTNSATANKIFANKLIYDDLGRVKKSVASQEIDGQLGEYAANLPGDAEQYASTVDYDLQGRVIRTTAADNSCSLTTYEGRRTYVLDPEANLAIGQEGIFENGLKTDLAFIYLKNKSNPPTNNSCQGEIGRLDLDHYNEYTRSIVETNILGQALAQRTKEGSRILRENTSIYDGFGRVSQTNDPDLGQNGFQYTALGNLVNTTDNAGRTAVFQYDNLNRITDKYWGDALKAHFVYDQGEGAPVGRLAKEITTDLVEKTFVYSLKGQIEKSIFRFLQDDFGHYLGNTVSVVSGYNTAGQIKQQGFGLLPAKTGLNDTVTYTYDQAGRLKNIHSQELGSLVADITYNRFGLVEQKNLAHETVEKFNYHFDDKSLRLASHQVWRSNQSLLALDYPEYDAVGSLLTKTDNVNNESFRYQYDDLYRLTDVSSPYQAHFEYDKLGRMKVKNEAENQASFNFNSSFPLHAPKAGTINNNQITLEYDQAGNLTNNRDQKLFYDQENRLTLVQNSASQVLANYAYDQGGQRIKKWQEGAGECDGADVDHNGLVNLFDLMLVANNADCDLNSSQAIKAGVFCRDLDINQDGEINKLDTEIAGNCFGTYTTSGESAFYTPAFEITKKPNLTTFKKYYPGGVLRVVSHNGSQITESKIYQLHSDYLGSTKLVTDRE